MDVHSILIRAVHRPFVPVGKLFRGASTCRGLHSRTATAASIHNNPRTSTETSNVAVSPQDTIAQLVFKVRDLGGAHGGATIASPTAMAWLLVLQALALVGAAVGGILARNRRRSLLEANEKLRRINEGLRAKSSPTAAWYFSSMDGEEDLRVKEEGEKSAMIKQSLEKSLGGPSAAHPNESYGFEDFGSSLSLAQARRVIDTCIRDTKLKLHPILKSSSNQPQRERYKGEIEGVVESLNQALRLATDIKDPWAERILIRLRGKAQRLAGNLRLALVDLQDVLSRLRQDEDAANTKQLENMEHVLAVEAIQTELADVLGELGDVFTELGEYEAAGKAYDDCLAVMNDLDEHVILP